jgi:DNA repair protein SbcD/Mre11
MLHGMSREREHREFVRWLVRALEAEQIDVLVITGDIFDSATPPASADATWFEFLAQARTARPTMDIVAIAGNHDSPSRLSAPTPVLQRLGVQVVGRLPRLPKEQGGGVDVDRVLFPVAGGRAVIAAVPFLRPLDFGSGSDGFLDAEAGTSEAATAEPAAASPAAEGAAWVGAGADPTSAAAAARTAAGVVNVYREVAEGARARLAPDQAFIVTGHLYTAGAEPSWLSERRISMGGQEAFAAGMFPVEAGYVALGHMHRAQRVLVEHVRYAGAPIPLAMTEASYRHQVVVVEFEGARRTQVRTLDVPRAVEIVRVPRLGAAPLDEVLAELARLPALGGRAEADPGRPFLEVVVALARPEPRLRATIDAALEGKLPRLIRLGVEGTGDGAALGDHRRGQQLSEISPTEVFERCWHRRYGEPPSVAIRGAFARLLEEVQHRDGELPVS